MHNGIIENHDELRAELSALGYVFQSQTDTEVIAHLVDHMYSGDLFETVKLAVKRLHGAYAIAVFSREEPHRVVAARQGSPLIVGIGKGENFVASDAMALASKHHRPDHLPGRRRRGRPATGQVLDRGRGRQVGRARDQDRARAHRRGRTRPLPSLHAERNLRTAARDRRHPRRRDRHHAGTVQRRRRQGIQGNRPRPDPGLRHQLLQPA
ncbi:hypothetical protein LP420_20340 [Massilia sp. B-10]|nr:hypothetical protein LP420_20340 [Massilia sp. B-10]